MPIETLLIANRGEIACRVIASAQRMGIRTVAVYSTVDRNALHVSHADEAICLGAPPPTESYLNIDAILGAALAVGADAIHPGYGFLAENADFAERCAKASLVFVGPPANAIREMGLKGLARERMEKAGVPVLPGINNVATQLARAKKQVTAIGYPLLIKPEAGGGGKGMKIVGSEAELGDALESARREAKSAFGNDQLMIERYLEGPRHIEIQVFADGHGNAIHLNERDCSLQRRHQKIVEEAPAPGVSAELRNAMGDAAVKAAQAIGYVGAGTVEFLLGNDGRFYFMEMNTRLQVEHPVTEAITGFDLVEWQLAVAAGNPLPVSQQGVGIDGHAIEVRLYAEDPLNDFLPVAGRLARLVLPRADGIRIDNGLRQHDVVSVFYDPMMMKIIAHGEDRNAALDRLRRALAATHIAGIRTNRDFLAHIVAHAPFAAGELGTDYLDHHLAEVLAPPDVHLRRHALAAAALILSSPFDENMVSPWDTATNFRLNASHVNSLVLGFDGVQHEAWIEKQDGEYTVGIDGDPLTCGFVRNGEKYVVTAAGAVLRVTAYRHDHRLTLISDNRTFEFSVPLEESFVPEDAGSVQAPMSGKVISIHVKTGDEVKRSTTLAVIEAMKMEHAVKAPANGTIGEIHYGVGDIIDEGREILDFAPSEET